MSEIIEKIEKITEREGWQSMAGYLIKTNKQNITMMIDDEQSCCEEWGYFMCNDDVSDFVGATLLDIKVTDQALNKETCKKEYEFFGDFDYGGDSIFVDIETNKGVLQFVAYNDHNGYYGHQVKIKSDQLTVDDHWL